MVSQRNLNLQQPWLSSRAMNFHRHAGTLARHAIASCANLRSMRALRADSGYLFSSAGPRLWAHHKIHGVGILPTLTRIHPSSTGISGIHADRGSVGDVRSCNGSGDLGRCDEPGGSGSAIPINDRAVDEVAAVHRQREGRPPGNCLVGHQLAHGWSR